MKYYYKGQEISQEIWSRIRNLEEKNSRYEKALCQIDAPMRSDGTFNLCREACQKLAEEALKEV